MKRSVVSVVVCLQSLSQVSPYKSEYMPTLTLFDPVSELSLFVLAYQSYSEIVHRDVQLELFQQHIKFHFDLLKIV